jgi:EmrB/QacA subfamily drug resistance transporter
MTDAIVSPESAEPPPPDKPKIVGDKKPSELGSRLATIAVASALFMEFIDSTALSTALPTLSHAFGVDPIHLKLALTSYIVALAVIAPASGWMADRYGPRRIFLIAMVAFLAGSCLCGFSRSLGELIASRIIQGIGGGMMTPVGRLIVVGSAPRDRLVSAMSWFTMPALVGPLIGPPLAGFVLAVAQWPWIFFINVPVGIIGVTAVMRFVPQLKQPHPGQFDLKGFFICAVAISALVVASETLGAGLVSIWAQAAAVLLALGAGTYFVNHALNTEKPILDLHLIRYPTYRASLLGGTLMRLGIGATPFLMPLLLQVGLGWSPLRAGSVTIAIAFGAFISKPVVPKIIRHSGFRSTLITANLFGGILTAAPAIFRENTPVALIMILLALSGFVRSTQFTAINTVAYADVPPKDVSHASTLATVAQQVGLCVGISFGGLMLHLARGANGALTPDRFVIPFIAVGLVTMLAGPVYSTLHPDAGAAIGGRAPKKTKATS